MGKSPNMAFISVNYCAACEKEISHTNGACSICRERGERERIAAWNALTTEEKLQDLRKRVEKLEHGPIRF